MAEAHQARMQNEVEEMVQSLERDHIRKMQVGVHSLYLSDLFSVHHVSHLCLLAAGSHVQLQCRVL